VPPRAAEERRGDRAAAGAAAAPAAPAARQPSRRPALPTDTTAYCCRGRIGVAGTIKQDGKDRREWREEGKGGGAPVARARWASGAAGRGSSATPDAAAAAAVSAAGHGRR